jgi:hypothetical protein
VQQPQPVFVTGQTALQEQMQVLLWQGLDEHDPESKQKKIKSNYSFTFALYFRTPTISSE